MVYDCFTFWNELDILRIRLNTLRGVVDQFVLVEATKTFSGENRKLCFAERKEEFKEFPIIYIVVDDMPDGRDRWAREYHQRNAIMRGLPNLRDSDLVLISDVDEIPHPDIVRKRYLGGYQQQMFYYCYNLLTGYDWIGTAALSGKQLLQTTPQLARETIRNRMLPTVSNAGWHFSWIGDHSQMLAKLGAFSHAELDTAEMRAAMSTRVASCVDFAGRSLDRFKPLALTSGAFPDYVVSHAVELGHIYPVDSELHTAWRFVRERRDNDEASLAYERLQSGIITAPSEQPLIDIVVLSWAKDKEHYEMTCRCVNSLSRSSPTVPIRVTIVETNDRLPFESFISDAPLYASCNVVYPNEPFGFNRFIQIACRNLEHSTAPYLMILNNDVVAYCPDFLTKMLAAMKQAEIASPVGLRELTRKPGPDNGIISCNAEPNWFEGFCYLIDKKIFNQSSVAAFFPEELSFYFQDNYFLAKAIKMNYRVVSAREAECLHLGWRSQDLLAADQKALFLGGQKKTYEELLNKMNDAKNKIILVTMVRNEAKIVARMLASALSFVDAVVLVDTGSTDDTVAVAEATVGDKTSFMLARREWVDFSTNRNQALEAGRRCADDLGWDRKKTWLLLLDGDHVLVAAAGGENKPLAIPDADLIKLYQDDGTYRYPNARLLRASAEAKYIGRTHEYLDCGGSTAVMNEFAIDDKNDGGFKADKFERDLRLLQLDWDEHKNGRTAFYMAQTYRMLGKHSDAADWYRKRIALGQPHEQEEVWYSRLCLGRSLLALRDKVYSEEQFQKAFFERPWRAEPLHELAQMKLDSGQQRLACQYAAIGLALPFPQGESLFVEKDVYQWGLRRDIAIGAYYAGDTQSGKMQSDILRLLRGSPYREEALHHLTHYIGQIPARIVPVPFQAEPGWHPCNPSIIADGSGYVMILRTVNYTIEAGHAYALPPSNVVQTRNFLLRLRSDLTSYGSPVELHTPEGYPGSPIQGFEDVRIYKHDGDSITALANRSDWGAMVDGQRLVPRMHQVSWFNCGATVQSSIINITPNTVCEKNWLPFVDKGRNLAIYWHDPFKVIDLDTHAVAAEQKMGGLDLSGFRGSAGPIPWDGGWLYVVHEVCRREISGLTCYFYMHRICWMTSDYVLKHFSELFYYEQLGVEFCCGMALHPDGVVMTYGVRDNIAKIAIVANAVINQALQKNTIQP